MKTTSPAILFSLALMSCGAFTVTLFARSPGNSLSTTILVIKL